MRSFALALCATLLACSGASKSDDLFNGPNGDDAGTDHPGNNNGTDASTGGDDADDGLGSGIPITGDDVPAALKPFDDAVIAFMATRKIEAGALAVMHQNKLVLSHGYGTMDGTAPVPPNALFRIASISKTITAAAVRKLIAENKLSASGKAYQIIGLQPQIGTSIDPRIYQITVQQLLDHKGGWDSAASGFDPVFESRAIAKAMGLTTSPTKRDVARYMMGRPLDFDPGVKTAYSNFGYSLLGLVIEAVTGKTYIDYTTSTVLAPVGAGDVELASVAGTAREPKYYDPNECSDAVDVKSATNVPCPYGGFNITAFDAFGGLVASAPTLVSFLDAYSITGEKGRPKAGPVYYFYGSLPGSYGLVYQVSDGTTNIAVLFDRRTYPINADDGPLKELFDQALTKVASNWP
jgi:N-acyl-D-amino-acid deacylase